MGTRAQGILQTAYVRHVRVSVWRAFRAEALRRSLSPSEALEIMIDEWMNGKAETRLAAAAPDMLAALRPFAEQPRQSAEDVSKARTAIAKAGGTDR